jgi:hypothetical protein
MAPSRLAWRSGTHQSLESRQLDWRDSFISRARRIDATQKGQIWKKHFVGFISQIMIKKTKIEKKNPCEAKPPALYDIHSLLLCFFLGI